jgi:hypothetical protein
MAYGEEDTIEYDGEFYCYFDDEVWIWDHSLMSWMALIERPEFLTVIHDRVAIVDVTTGKHYCNCPRYQIPNGCFCGGI